MANRVFEAELAAPGAAQRFEAGAGARQLAERVCE